MAHTRSAYHTLQGYQYQFDKSILEILQARGDERVVLEGIEDIDVGEDAIQCKYHATQKYTPSSVRKPILAFLKHYCDSNTALHYRLYAHFDDMSSFVPIDLDELKKILGDSLDELGVTDTDLSEFLAYHFNFEHGVDIDSQLDAVHGELQASLSCTRDESELYFYNNALHEVIRLSRQPEAAKRTTTRSAFVRVINQKRLLFSMWLCQLQSKKAYRKYVKECLESTRAMAPSKNRWVWLDRGLFVQDGATGVAAFCERLIDRYYRLGHALKDAQPLCIIIDIGKEQILAVKQGLLARSIAYNDGFEHVAFQEWAFNGSPVINLKQTPNKKALTDKIGASSYTIRLLSSETFAANKTAIDAPDTLIVTGASAEATIQASLGTHVVQIVDVENLEELSDILN